MTPFFWLRWFLRIVALVVGLAVLYTGWVVVQICWVAHQTDNRRSDAIVVLGASQYNGKPTEVFAARLEHAIALYDAHVAPRIITVGGKEPGDRYTEARAANSYLVAHGVPDNAILPVETGSDTLQSVQAVARTFTARGWHTAVVVTDPWHCLRARTMARDAGIDAVTSPEHGGPAVGSFSTDVHYVYRETLAYIYYRIFGNDAVHSTGAV